jgi:DNA-binding NarL/FixJ family response regulator
MKASIMLAGHYALTNEALRYVLKHRGYHTISTKGNFNEIRKSIQRESPDIVIWDDNIILNQFGSILDFTLSAEETLTSVLILHSKMLHFMAEALLNGVKGFVHKNSSIQDLEECLHAVSQDKVFISPRLAGDSDSYSENGFSGLLKKGLTQRELTILTLVAQGKTSRMIAEILGISVRTVENHRQNICNKLGLKGRNGLLRFSQVHCNSQAKP